MTAPANAGSTPASTSKRGHLCAACGGAARGLHWRNPDRGDAAITLHLCDRPECRALAGSIDYMSETDLTAIEKNAAIEAIPAVAEYLEKIGKSDLYAMAPEEANAMMFAAIDGYRRAIMKGICEAPPF